MRIDQQMYRYFLIISIAGGYLFAFPSLARAVTFTEDTLIDSVNHGYDGQPVVVDNCTVTIDGSHTFASLTLVNNGIITHSANDITPEYSLDLTITSDVNIGVNTSINLSGRGYRSSAGPGAGFDWFYASGAGHAGQGGRSRNWVLGGGVYGSIDNPSALGSGGGRDDDEGRPGGAGGGLLHMVIGGTLTVNGTIQANGANSTGNQAGGGSGGSVWISTASLMGNGTISANGGNADQNYAGGGSGGRIAVYYSQISSFDGDMVAFGGSGYYYGAAGTIYLKDNNKTLGRIIIKSNTSHNREHTFMDAATPEENLQITSQALVEVLEPISLASLEIRDENTILFPSLEQSLELTVDNDVNVRTGAVITANGRGYASSEGSGSGGDSFWAAGGGYGGRGGNSKAPAFALGGDSYGSITQPVDFGSGGGLDKDHNRLGGRGGGAIHIAIGGTLTVNGTISADGGAGVQEAGGGAGGSIWLTMDTFEGNGVIRANGGGAHTGVSGGGSGGRIALYYGETDFDGLIASHGGEAWHSGAPGTIYTKVADRSHGNLLIESGGITGNITPLDTAYWPEEVIFSLTVSDAAVAYIQDKATFDDIELRDGGIITHESGLNIFDVTALDDVNIRTGCAIQANGRGYSSSTGPGAGEDNTYAAGGGYGGYGGNSTNGAQGGSPYGSITEPNALGSGGGRDLDANRAGGAGGGAIRLTVADKLTVNGTLSANGNNALNEAGGGSGGSLWITVGKLEGNGIISANGGGAQTGVSGGGSGGRIAVYYDEIDGFDGEFAAYGGDAKQAGAAGTVYLKQKTKSHGLLKITANRPNRRQTLLDAATPQDNLLISGGAWVEIGVPLQLESIDIQDNSSYLTSVVGQRLDVTVQNNVNIRTGAFISADGRGYGYGQGPGAGKSYYYASGAGHGGIGGSATRGTTPGGGTYGNLMEPITFGSGGGYDTDAGRPGGAGGGVIRLKVFGTLTVNGTLSANGSGSANEAGGGAGGSIWLTVGTLNGNGIIRANGGQSGNINVAGGGGGGRIAIYWRDSYSDFARLEVNGAARGGQQGTIFLHHGFLVGDIDLDGQVNINDLALFSSHWLELDCHQPQWCANADINHDTGVDIDDFAIITRQWHKGQ